MTGSVTAAVALACVAVAILSPLPLAPQPAVAATTKTCDLTHDARRLGPTYVTSLKVRNVSCTIGRQIVRDYYRCRVHAGGVSGRCRAQVHHYRCSEHREGIAIQFDAKVVCTRGTRRVTHTYTQDT
ncbi:MAG: hypothetical protein QOE11_2432 [Solirubrobacteraceae bacterium]|jgi:hypothetical protein|nr:hypothetical protein [Solirubrobacteraceae bacterium]